VRIKAVSVNPVDFKKRDNFGNNQEPIAGGPLILGYDAAGVVEEAGAEVSLFKVGDEVYFAGSLGRQGTNAQYTLVDERIAALKPKSLSFEDASALPLTSITAWEGLADKFKLPKPDGPAKHVLDKSLLVLNGAGGVGSMVIQLAKKLFGFKTVIATASRPVTIEWVKKLGADIVIDHKKDLVQELKANGFEGGVDYLFSCFDLDVSFDKFPNLLAPFGHVVSIVSAGKPLNLDALFFKSQSFHFEFMFSKPLFGYDLKSQHDALTVVAQNIDNGTLLNTKTRSIPFSLEGLIEAHNLVDAAQVHGKLVLPFGADW